MAEVDRFPGSYKEEIYYKGYPVGAQKFELKQGVLRQLIQR